MDAQAVSGFAAIRQHDPALDEVGLIAEVRRIVFGVCDAFSRGDSSISRPVMGDAAWAEQHQRIADLQAQGRRHTVSNLSISDVTITGAYTDGVLDTVTARVTYTAVEQDVDAGTGHPVPGAGLPALTPRTESWTLQRPAAVTTPIPGATQVRCPTCGATVATGSATCAYCHQPLPAGSGWRVTLIAPAPSMVNALAGAGYGDSSVFFPTMASSYTDGISVSRGGLGCGGWIGLIIGGLGVLAGIAVPIYAVTHRSSTSSSSPSGSESSAAVAGFPDPTWHGSVHLTGGYTLAATAFSEKAGRFDLTCAELASSASPQPSTTLAMPTVDLVMPDKTRILINAPNVATFTGAGTYQITTTSTGSVNVSISPQGRTGTAASLWVNQNAAAMVTVVLDPSGSGSVTLTHLNDPFLAGKPGEFIDGGYTWTCSQGS